MIARIRQNSIGKFNLCGNENSLEFTLAIMECDKVVEDNGNKAVLKISKREDDCNLKSLQDELEEYFEKGYFDNIFEYAWEYANKVWSSTDYKAQCIAFANVYGRWAESINAELFDKRKKDIQAQIDALQKRLDELREIPNVLSEIGTIVLKDADKYLRWAGQEKDKLKDLIPESETYKKIEDKFNEYMKKANEIKNFVDKFNLS